MKTADAAPPQAKAPENSDVNSPSVVRAYTSKVHRIQNRQWHMCFTQACLLFMHKEVRVMALQLYQQGLKLLCNCMWLLQVYSQQHMLHAMSSWFTMHTAATCARQHLNLTCSFEECIGHYRSEFTAMTNKMLQDRHSGMNDTVCPNKHHSA